MLNKVKVSTIPLQNGECAVDIVITIGTEQPKKVKQESTIYAETLEALAETWMDKDQSNHDNDEDEGFLKENRSSATLWVMINDLDLILVTKIVER